MKNLTKKGLISLSKRASFVFGAALASLTSLTTNSIAANTDANSNENTVNYSQPKKVRTMNVLKLNMNNSAESYIVSGHRSHASHSSHSSHSSHRSGGF